MKKPRFIKFNPPPIPRCQLCLRPAEFIEHLSALHPRRNQPRIVARQRLCLECAMERGYTLPAAELGNSLNQSRAAQ